MQKYPEGFQPPLDETQLSEVRRDEKFTPPLEIFLPENAHVSSRFEHVSGEPLYEIDGEITLQQIYGPTIDQIKLTLEDGNVVVVPGFSGIGKSEVLINGNEIGLIHQIHSAAVIDFQSRVFQENFNTSDKVIQYWADVCGKESVIIDEALMIEERRHLVGRIQQLLEHQIELVLVGGGNLSSLEQSRIIIEQSGVDMKRARVIQFPPYIFKPEQIQPVITQSGVRSNTLKYVNFDEVLENAERAVQMGVPIIFRMADFLTTHFGELSQSDVRNYKENQFPHINQK